MRTRFVVLFTLALTLCVAAIAGQDPILIRQKTNQVTELKQKLEALQKVEQDAQQLDQLKTEQSRLRPIVSMGRQYDRPIEALRQKIATADAALEKAGKEWGEFANSGAVTGDIGMQVLNLLRGVSLLETSNRDRFSTLATALQDAQNARAQVEPDIAELKRLLLEQKKLRACPDPDYAGQDLQACQARLAELDQSVPALANETFTARGDRVAEINRLTEEISKLNRELAGTPRTPQNRRPAAPAEPNIPTIKVYKPDEQRLAQGVGPAPPEVTGVQLGGCAVLLEIRLDVFDRTVVPCLRIEIEGFGTFWGFPNSWSADRTTAYFAVYVPVTEGPFAMTISAPNVPGCQPVTIHAVRSHPGGAPTQQQMDELVNSINRLQQELNSAQSETAAQSKHYQLAKSLALFAEQLTALSHFAEALHYAVEAAKHFQAAGNIGEDQSRMSILKSIATAAFVGGDVQILEAGLFALAEVHRQIAERAADPRDADMADSFFSMAASDCKLAGNCIATIGGEGELPRARAAWRKALEYEARRPHPDTRCPAWTKE